MGGTSPGFSWAWVAGSAGMSLLASLWSRLSATCCHAALWSRVWAEPGGRLRLDQLRGCPAPVAGREEQLHPWRHAASRWVCRGPTLSHCSAAAASQSVHGCPGNACRGGRAMAVYLSWEGSQLVCCGIFCCSSSDGCFPACACRRAVLDPGGVEGAHSSSCQQMRVGLAADGGSDRCRWVVCLATYQPASGFLAWRAGLHRTGLRPGTVPVPRWLCRLLLQPSWQRGRQVPGQRGPGLSWQREGVMRGHGCRRGALLAPRQRQHQHAQGLTSFKCTFSPSNKKWQGCACARGGQSALVQPTAAATSRAPPSPRRRTCDRYRLCAQTRPCCTALGCRQLPLHSFAQDDIHTVRSGRRLGGAAMTGHLAAGARRWQAHLATKRQ